MSKADPILLEPIMKVVVTVPEEYMGDVMGDVSSRRGQITGMETRNGTAQINSFIPQSNMFATQPTCVQRRRAAEATPWSPATLLKFQNPLLRKLPQRTKNLL